MASSISTGQLKINSVNDALTRISAGQTFLAVGRHLSDGNDSVPMTATNSETAYKDVYSHMVGGVKLAPFNAQPMIKRNTWATGKVFAQYEPSILTDCFVVVESGGSKFVYKCLDNNNGAVSSTAPSGTSSSTFKTADGYVWKYISTITDAVFSTFATSSKIPLTVNSVAIAASVPGTIDVVRVSQGGAGYANYISGALLSSDIQVNNAVTYKLPASASGVNGFYTGCLMEITNPASTAYGQARKVVDYNGTTKIVTLETAFTIAPSVNDTYDLSPAILFASTGQDVVYPVARAIIGASNTISSIKVLTAGKNNRVTTAGAVFHPSVGVTVSAVLTPVVSPAGGHGANPLAELNCSGYCVQANVNFSSIGIPSANEIRTASIIESPTFDNVLLSVSSNNPEKFVTGETILQYKRKGVLQSNVTYASTDLVSADLSVLEPNDLIMISSNTLNLVLNVNTVSNTTYATGVVPYGGVITGICSILTPTGSGIVKSTTSGVKLNKATPTFDVGTFIYGQNSHAVDTVSAVSINGRSTFTSFIQSTRLVGSLSSGTFAADEKVTPSVANGSAGYIHSISSNNNQLFLTNITGTLPSSNTVVGNTSGAVFSVTAKYDGDLNIDSGKIITIKNVTPISMAPNKQLSFKLLFDF